MKFNSSPFGLPTSDPNYRPAGQIVPIGGIANSVSTGNLLSSLDPTYILVSVTLKTKGRPVMLVLQGDGSANGSGVGLFNASAGTTGNLTGTVVTYRNETPIDYNTFNYGLASSIFGNGSFIIGPQAIVHIDTPPAGEYTYVMRFPTGLGSTTGLQIKMSYMMLTAFEL